MEELHFFFFTTTIYIIEVSTSIPHKNSVNKIMALLGNRIIITEIIFLIFGVFLILIILFFYIFNINKFCKQIILLGKLLIYSKCKNNKESINRFFFEY